MKLKRFSVFLALVVVGALLTPAAGAVDWSVFLAPIPEMIISQTTSALTADTTMPGGVYKSDGGDRMVVASGGELWVVSGGKIRLPITTVTADTTLTLAQSGLTVVANAADKVLTLPPTEQGCWYRVVLGPSGLSTGTGLSLSPNASDKIMGNGLTSADDKDLICSGGSDREGDCVLLFGDGNLGWYVVHVTGTWARES